LSRNNITVLGIHYFIHDAGAALVQNGKVLASINEEKIRNIKHCGGYPTKSIEEVFKIAKLDPSEVDAVAIVGIMGEKILPLSEMFPNYRSLFSYFSLLTGHKKGIELLTSYLQRIKKIDAIKNEFTKLGIPLNEIIFVEHHAAHAAAACYLSPWDLDEEVMVLTLDGQGDGISSTVNIGHKGEIRRVENSETSYYDSLGLSFYSQITAYLGMDWGFDAYKVMGLAPYGKPELSIDRIKQIIDIDKTNPLKFRNKIDAYMHAMQPKLRDMLKNDRFDNIAAATQSWFETLITKWVSNAVEKTGIRKIACAGGSFLNVKANRKILSLDDVDDVFFCPAASDEGLAVGAALKGYFEIALRDGIKPVKEPLKSNYFGSSFTNDQIKDALKNHDMLDKAQYIDDIDDEVGELLATSDMVVARFSGRLEWGPRALGNRSILANPSDPRIVRKINNAIKMRDFWMPFGPSILSTRIDDYLVDPINSPYMMLAFDTTEKRDDISAALHPYDFTSRPQTVTPEYNSGYEKVLKSFESKTGIGGVLNTSFNIHGYPIVWDPERALDTLNNSSLDALAIGNYLVRK
jgi:carbamoyltransferase